MSRESLLRRAFDQEQRRLAMEETTEILEGRGYLWHNWSFVRDQTHMYIWSDTEALHFLLTSNGWFQFFQDGYMNGCYCGPVEKEQPKFFAQLFWEDFLKAQLSVHPYSTLYPLFTNPTKQYTITIGNWKLSAFHDRRLTIVNTQHTDQMVTLKSFATGFVYHITEENYSIKSEYGRISCLAGGWRSPNTLILREEMLKKKFKFYSKLGVSPNAVTTLPQTLFVPVDLDHLNELLRPVDSYDFDNIGSTEWKSTNFSDPPISLSALPMVPTLDAALYLAREWDRYGKTCKTNRLALKRQVSHYLLRSATKTVERHPWRGHLSRTPAVAYEMLGDQAEWLRERELEVEHEISHLYWIIIFGRRPYVCKLYPCSCKPIKRKKRFPKKPE